MQTNLHKGLFHNDTYIIHERSFVCQGDVELTIWGDKNAKLG